MSLHDWLPLPLPLLLDGTDEELLEGWLPVLGAEGGGEVLPGVSEVTTMRSLPEPSVGPDAACTCNPPMQSRAA